jgi:type I restriction enzyme, S subunit
MSRYEKYPAYRDSGVEWIGEIPGHWECIKIKHLSQVQRGASPRPIDDQKYFDDEGEYSWVRISDVTASNKYLECTEQRLSEIGKTLSIPLQPGQLFLSIAGSVGKPIITKINCCIHDGFVYFPYLKECTDFLYYIFLSGQPFLGLGKMGTQLNLNTDTVGSISIPVPPLDEQQAIASFLDRKTAQIDELITKKEELLKKLDEKRTALITQSVTKGLDPSAPMKESGVEWIGEIPKHWEVKRLKNIASCNDESLTENTDPQYEILYIDISSVNLNQGITHKEALPFEKAPSRARRIVRHGDTIVSTVRTYLKAIAPIIEPDENLIVSTGFAVIRPLKSYSYQFLGYFLQTEGFVGQVVANSVGVSYPAINATEILQLPAVIPPYDEQQAIAEHIDKKTAIIDRQKAQVTEAIERLKEYRTALITDAVTGKMDVQLHEKTESLSA